MKEADREEYARSIVGKVFTIGGPETRSRFGVDDQTHWLCLSAVNGGDVSAKLQVVKPGADTPYRVGDKRSWYAEVDSRPDGESYFVPVEPPQRAACSTEGEEAESLW